MTSFADLPELPDYFEVKKSFAEELKAASLSRKSSFLYLKNALPAKPLVSDGMIQAIVIGGTHFEFATIRIEKHKIAKTISRKSGILPQLNDIRTFSQVFLENYDPSVDAVGVNFAFTLTPCVGEKDELDGILRDPSKEHMFKGLIGVEIGRFLRERIYKRSIPISVANDSTCLVLAGGENEHVGLVLGTGINISLKVIENNKKYIINPEAGNFSGFTKSKILNIIDSHSEHPGTYLFEKMVAGKYLFQYYNEAIKELKLNIPLMNSSEELSATAQEEENTAGKLARSIMQMSASLVAAALAGAYECLNKPVELHAIIEGSLFWKGWEYQNNVKIALLMLGIPDSKITFKKIEDSSLKGAIGLLTI